MPPIKLSRWVLPGGTATALALFLGAPPAPAQTVSTPVTGTDDPGDRPRTECDAAAVRGSEAERAAQCNDPAWVASPCGQTAEAQEMCAQSLRDFTAAFSPNTQSIKASGDAILPTGASRQLSSVVPAIAGAGKTWSAQEQRARLAAMGMMVPIGFKPDKYHRAPTWDSAPGAGGPGASVDSCEEYVYESFYDMERWIDATNACRSDARCAMTMTFWGYDGTKSTLSPGVANRDLRNKTGVPIKSYYGTDFQMSLFGGTAMSMAKNEYFAGSAAYVPDSMVAALTAMNPTWGAFAKDLQKRLRQGLRYYQIKHPTKVNGQLDPTYNLQEGFRDVWDFHYTMNQRTKATPMEIMDDYQLRRAHFAKKLERAEQLTGCDYMKQIGLGYLCYHPRAGGLFARPVKPLPGDPVFWPEDSFAARSLLSEGSSLLNFALPSATAFAIKNHMDLGAYSPGLLQNQILGTLNLQQKAGLIANAGVAFQQFSPQLLSGNLNLGGLASYWNPLMYSTPPAGMPPPPPAPPPAEPWPVKPNPAVGTLWQNEPFGVVEVNGYPRLNCAQEMQGADRTSFPRVAVCELTNLLIDEYVRALQAQPSCLALDNYACDWHPEEARTQIESAYLNAWNYVKESEYNFCKRLTGGGQVDSGNPQNSPDAVIPTISRSTLTLFRAALQSRFTALSDILKKAPIKEKNALGTHKGDKEKWGTDLFNAHYDYDLGWEVRLYPNQNDPTKICQIGGAVEGGAGAGITVFGIDAELFDVGLALRANDSETHQNDQLAHVKANADVLGIRSPGQSEPSWMYRLFDPLDKAWDLNQQFSVKNGEDESQTLFHQDFQIWYFTVTIEVGIGVRYGAEATFSTKVPNDCASQSAPSPVLFEAKAGVGPYLDLYAIADAEISLAHIIGFGVEVQLTILGVQLPIGVTSRIVNDSDGLGLTIDAGLDMRLHSLDGILKGYVEIFFGKIKQEIVRWDGLGTTIPLFHTPPLRIGFGHLGAIGSVPPPSYYSNE